MSRTRRCRILRLIAQPKYLNPFMWTYVILNDVGKVTRFARFDLDCVRNRVFACDEVVRYDLFHFFLATRRHNRRSRAIDTAVI